jgi:hemerythrin-like domain-containing protein
MVADVVDILPVQLSDLEQILSMAEVGSTYDHRRVSTSEHRRLVAWHRELIAAHERLRAALELAQRSVSDQHRAGRDLLLYCLGFCSALAGHHTSEDENLFPELSARHPALSETITKLTQDHSMIAYLLGQLEAAIRSDASPEQLGGHLEGISAIMESHFRYEERQLLDVLATLELDADVETVLGPL